MADNKINNNNNLENENFSFVNKTNNNDNQFNKHISRMKYDEKKRNDANNANTLKNAANVAEAIPEPHAKAIGKAVNMLDDATGGKATEIGGKIMTKTGKITGTQNLSNKLAESGLGDKIGSAAKIYNGKGNKEDFDNLRKNQATRNNNNNNNSISNSDNKKSDNKDKNNSKNNKSDDKSTNADVKFKKLLKTKLLMIGVSAFCTFLLISTLVAIAGASYDGTVGKVKKVFQSVGNFVVGLVSSDEEVYADEDYSTSKDELKKFSETMKKVLEDEKSDKNKKFFISEITGVFVVINNVTVSHYGDTCSEHGCKFGDFSESDIKKVYESMLDDNKKYDEDTFENNLEDTLEEFLSFASDNQIKQYKSDVLEYLKEFKEEYKDDSLEYVTATTSAVYDANVYVWPVGSNEITEKNGKKFALGEPATTNITSGFENRTIGGVRQYHNGIDIANGSPAGELNIVAARAGEVVYPFAGARIDYGTGSFGNRDGGGFGNYVKIKHSDGTYTVYGHMYANSITVMAGEQVEAGQVIGKMGTSGSSTGVHLHFGVYSGGDTSAFAVNPLDYVDPDNPRPSVVSGADFSLTSTIFTEAEFTAKMQDYYNRSGNTAFKTNFLDHVSELYSAAIQYGVNPELVVVTAKTEQGFVSCGGGTTGNYWGIGIPNGGGCSAGPRFPTLADGVKGYAETLKAYEPGGRFEAEVNQRYQERLQAGCTPGGYGPAGSLAGMQSVYSWLGNFRANPGNWGLGGCVYLNRIYGANYCSTISTCSCNSKSTCVPGICPESSRTTVCEQSDYTLYQLNEKIEARLEIFGL